jgi:hypothetical protein
MIEREADPTAPVGQLSLSSARSSDGLELPSGLTEREQQELLNYTSVPPRNTQMLLVRFRPGSRLKPLPYSMDDEDSYRWNRSVSKSRRESFVRETICRAAQSRSSARLSRSWGSRTKSGPIRAT